MKQTPLFPKLSDWCNGAKFVKMDSLVMCLMVEYIPQTIFMYDTNIKGIHFFLLSWRQKYLITTFNDTYCLIKPERAEIEKFKYNFKLFVVLNGVNPEW